MDGYEVCRALRADPATQFLPVVMVTASGDQEKVRGDRGGRRRLHHQAVRPGRAARARRGRCCASSATTTRSRRRPPSSPSGTASSSSASPSRSTSSSASAGCGASSRRSSPSSSSSSGDDSFLREPPARDHGGVLRPARLHRVRRDGRARGRDGRARRVPRGARRPRPPLRGHARALHRRRAHGLLQRPAAVRRRAGAGGADGGRDARAASASSPRAGAARATTSTSASASRRATRRSAAIGFEGRSDYAAIGSVTNLAARLCAEAAPGQILVSQRVHAAAEEIVIADAVGELALRGFSRPVRAYNVVGLDERARPRMSRRRRGRARG